MAHVREVTRKTGRAFEVRWRDGGKERQRTFTVKRDAERFALKVENAKEAGESTVAQTRSVPTVAQVAERVQATAALTLKPRTVHSAGLLYSGRVLPRFGTRRVTTITRADVEDWVAELVGEGLAPSTVHHCYVALRKVMKRAQHDRLVTYNPCDGVRLPRVQPDEDAVRFLTVAEVDRLASALAHEPVYALLVRFAAFTGLRAAEVAGLRVGDVDLARGHVSVRQTLQRVRGEWVVGTPKSRRSTRDVPLVHSGLTADLRRYLMTHPNSGDPAALFWPGRAVGSHRVDYDRVLDVSGARRNYLTPAVERAGLGSMRFHDLRHTAASLWLAAGFKPYEVSRWLGHASLATTDAVYSHLYPTDYAEHIARFDAFAATA